jgi:hypothetical protein
VRRLSRAGALAELLLGNVLMTIKRGGLQRVAVVSTLRVDVGALVEQQLDDVLVE